jgi:hypothetical protein
VLLEEVVGYAPAERSDECAKDTGSAGDVSGGLGIDHYGR